MTIHDLKEWVSKLPPEFDSMNLVFRKYDDLKTGDAKEDEEIEDYYYAMDAPIVASYIDEENRECCFLDQKSHEFIVKKNLDLEKEE